MLPTSCILQFSQAVDELLLFYLCKISFSPICFASSGAFGESTGGHLLSLDNFLKLLSTLSLESLSCDIIVRDLPGAVQIYFSSDAG